MRIRWSDENRPPVDLTLVAAGLRLLPSCAGSIEHLVLSLPPRCEARQFADVYCGLIDALPARTRVTMVVEREAIPLFHGWASQLAVKRTIGIVDAGDEVQLTSWIRDAQIAVVGNGARPTLLSSRGNTRKDDGCVANLLHQQGVCEVITAPFEFEAGNLLVTDDHLFIGIDAIAKMEGENDEDRLSAFAGALAEIDTACRRVTLIKNTVPVPSETKLSSSLDGKPWTELFYFRNGKGSRQPLFHIDMFLSLAGKTRDGRQRILVGDPALAARLLGEEPHPGAMAVLFDEVAADLAGQGFEVIRNPMAFIYMDRSDQATRIWLHATSNNVLVQECRALGNVVWLPQFGHDNWPELQTIDAYNRQLWESFGYETRQIPKCQLLAENAGGIHCMTNVLERGGV